MFCMTTTQNYQLNQWSETDQVLHTDFNADNAKVDAALAGLAEGLAGKAEASALAAKADTASLETVAALAQGRARIRLGTYTGNGAASQTIDLGERPKAVLVLTSDGDVSDAMEGRHYGGLALDGQPVASSGRTILSIADQGFVAYYNSSYTIYTNSQNTVYVYLAVF